jgi:hypothetical protein
MIDVGDIANFRGDPLRVAGHRGLSTAVTIWSVPQFLRAGVPPRTRSTS